MSPTTVTLQQPLLPSLHSSAVCSDGKEGDEGTLTRYPPPPQNPTRKRSEEIKAQKSQGQPFLPFVSETDMSLSKLDSTSGMCPRSTTTFLGPLSLVKR